MTCEEGRVAATAPTVETPHHTRDLGRRAAGAPERTTAVVDDAVLIAGAALGGDLVLVADHVAQIPNGGDERDDPEAVEGVREPG